MHLCCYAETVPCRTSLSCIQLPCSYRSAMHPQTTILELMSPTTHSLSAAPRHAVETRWARPHPSMLHTAARPRQSSRRCLRLPRCLEVIEISLRSDLADHTPASSHATPTIHSRDCPAALISTTVASHATPLGSMDREVIHSHTTDRHTHTDGTSPLAHVTRLPPAAPVHAAAYTRGWSRPPLLDLSRSICIG